MSVPYAVRALSVVAAAALLAACGQTPTTTGPTTSAGSSTTSAAVVAPAGPIGSTTDWPVYADESIVGERIAMGAGAHGYSLFVDADDLIAAYGATVADISVPEER